MTKKSISITSAMLIALSLPLARAAVNVPGSIPVADSPKQTLAKKALQQIEASAAEVTEDAALLKIFTEANPTSDPYLLTALKDEDSQIGQEISSLEAQRELLAPWEQQAVDTTVSLLRSTAANTGSAIDYFDKNRARSSTEAYHDFAERVSRDSERIARVVRNEQVYVEERIWADFD